MDLAPFLLERVFARHEFSARRLLSSSDCESLSMAELIAGADAETLGMWDTLRLGYTESRGLPLLRKEIAALHPGARPSDVVEVQPSEGITLAMWALVKAGDRVVATAPAYQSLHEVARARGATVVPWEAREAEGGWRFDLDELRHHLQGGAAMLVVNFPHNPTGASLERAELDEAVALARGAGARIFSDEMYRLLEVTPGTALPSIVELDERSVVLGGMSKAFSLPGLRVGWLVSKDHDVLDRVAALKDYTTICGSAPSEVLALMGLRARAEIFARNRAIIEASLAALARFRERHDLFGGPPPRTSWVTLAPLRRPEGATAFCERLVREAGLFLVASTSFHFGDAHVRLGLGRADFPQGLDELATWLARS